MPSGGYFFTDLAHLERVIGYLNSIKDAIRRNSIYLEQAIQEIAAPAKDGPSERQAWAYTDSLVRALDHNQALARFATVYADRMTASKEQYAATEEDNTHRIPGDR